MRLLTFAFTIVFVWTGPKICMPGIIILSSLIHALDFQLRTFFFSLYSVREFDRILKTINRIKSTFSNPHS